VIYYSYNKDGDILKVKKFKLFEAILAMVCVILVTEACSPTAAIGNSQYFWWLFLLVFFFLPYGLISCELGLAYKDERGIFTWVKRAFGAKWASRVSYYYWVNFPIWIASLAVLVIDILEKIFFVSFSLPIKFLIEIIFIGLVCILGMTRLSRHKKLINIGTIIKVFLMLSLGLIGIYIAITKGSKTTFELKSFIPEFNIKSLSYLSVIVFNFIGFEILATFRKQVKNPRKQFPKIVLISGVFIAFFYMLTSFGLSVAIPKENLSLSTGLIESFEILLGLNGGIVINIISFMFIITLFVSLLSWCEGVFIQTKAASLESGLPKVFSYTTKKGYLIGSSFMTFLASVLIILTEPFIESDVFWNFFALNLITLLITYLPMFLAFLHLREKDKDLDRPYKVPGNKLVISLIAYIPMIILILSIFLTLIPTDFTYNALLEKVPIMLGVIIAIILGEVFVLNVRD